MIKENKETKKKYYLHKTSMLYLPVKNIPTYEPNPKNA